MQARCQYPRVGGLPMAGNNRLRIVICLFHNPIACEYRSIMNTKVRGDKVSLQS